MPTPPLRFAVPAALLALAAASHAHADDIGVAPAAPEDPAAPAESPLVITDVQSAQSCLGQWTAQLGPAGDGTLVALLGSDEDYTIDLAPDGVTVSRLSNCTINVTTKVAPGISYALTKVSYEGRASLDEGVIAEQTVAYGFSGGPLSPRVVQRFTGPFEGSTSLDQPFPEDALVWSRCDDPQPLQIRSSLYLANDAVGHGSLSMSLSPGVLMLVLDFATRPCPIASAPDARASGTSESLVN